MIENIIPYKPDDIGEDMKFLKHFTQGARDDDLDMVFSS